MGRSWTTLVNKQANLRPEATAVSDHLGHEYTFARLADAVVLVANAWHDHGLRPGERVIMLARNSADLLVQVLGVARAGGVPVLLNWRLPTAELTALVALVEPRAAVADAALTPQLDPCLDRATSRVTLHGDPASGWAPPMAMRGAVTADQRALPEPEVDPESVFVLLHTSGTTGRPKLIPLTYGGQLRGALRNAELAQMGSGAVHLRFSPMFHLAGLHSALIPVATGGTVHLLGGFDADEWLDLVGQLRANFVNLAPSAMAVVLDVHDRRADKPDLTSLREISYGTAPIGEPLLRRAVATFQCGFRQNYGMTEAQSPVAQLVPEDHRLRPDKLRSAGRPLPEWDIRFVDRAGNDVDPSVGGELAIRGGTLFPGYWHDPEATALVTLDGGWYRTGDVASLDGDGYLHLLDRAKDMIVTGGENVYPAEVESVLIGHPGVAQVAMIAVPSQRWGEAVHAVVVPRLGVRPTEAELIEWTRERLAHFKCPASIEFRPELPRTATGKVKKHVLRRPFWSGESRSIS